LAERQVNVTMKNSVLNDFIHLKFNFINRHSVFKSKRSPTQLCVCDDV